MQRAGGALGGALGVDVGAGVDEEQHKGRDTLVPLQHHRIRQRRVQDARAGRRVGAQLLHGGRQRRRGPHFCEERLKRASLRHETRGKGVAQPRLRRRRRVSALAAQTRAHRAGGGVRGAQSAQAQTNASKRRASMLSMPPSAEGAVPLWLTSTSAWKVTACSEMTICAPPRRQLSKGFRRRVLKRTRVAARLRSGHVTASARAGAMHAPRRAGRAHPAGRQLRVAP